MKILNTLLLVCALSTAWAAPTVGGGVMDSGKVERPEPDTRPMPGGGGVDPDSAPSHGDR